MTAVTYVVGVDPGLRGALALLAVSPGSAPTLIDAIDMPTVTERTKQRVDAVALARRFRSGADRDMARWPLATIAVIEQVASRPGQGVASMFTFGRSYGAVEGVLAGASIRINHVTPATWKRKLGLSGADKDASRGRALDLWPEQAELFARKKDVGRADAALIALAAIPNLGLHYPSRET